MAEVVGAERRGGRGGCMKWQRQQLTLLLGRIGYKDYRNKYCPL